MTGVQTCALPISAAQLEKEQYLRKQTTERAEEAAGQQAALQERLQETVDRHTAAAEEAEEVEKAIQKGQEMLSQEADQRTALEQEQSRLAERRSQLKIGMMELEKDMDTLARKCSSRATSRILWRKNWCRSTRILPCRKI